jgi:hypothetical protein
MLARLRSYVAMHRKETKQNQRIQRHKSTSVVLGVLPELNPIAISQRTNPKGAQKGKGQSRERIDQSLLVVVI